MKTKRSKEINKIFKVIIITIICIIAFIYMAYNNNHYTAKGYIDKIENNTITIIDITGKTWEYSITKDYNQYDKVKIYFNENKTTEDRTDDIIIKIKKF